MTTIVTAAAFLRFERAMGIKYQRAKSFSMVSHTLSPQHSGEHSKVTPDGAVQRSCARIP
jgi:hypothetical protein